MKASSEEGLPINIKKPFCESKIPKKLFTIFGGFNSYEIEAVARQSSVTETTQPHLSYELLEETKTMRI
jgi:hypothetical protein